MKYSLKTPDFTKSDKPLFPEKSRVFTCNNDY